MLIKCVGKLRDKNNKIIGYKIMNNQNEVVCVTPGKLKDALSRGTFTCTNLKLTKDGRLIDVVEKSKYYRYSIYRENKFIGGLFRGIETVLFSIYEFAEEGDEMAMADYEDVNGMIGEIEYGLKFPEIKGKNIVFYFKEQTRNEILDSLNKVKHIINDYGYTLTEDVVSNINKSKIVYEDDDQIAIVK